jgi:hypothetical protein
MNDRIFILRGRPDRGCLTPALWSAAAIFIMNIASFLVLNPRALGDHRREVTDR